MNKYLASATEDVPETGHAWAAPPGRFPEDDFLRDRKFKIHRRPKGKEATWLFKGIVFKHSEALQKASGMETDAKQSKPLR